MSYPTFKMVWLGRWIRTDEVERLRGEGTMMLNEERINKMLDTAAEAGYKRGWGAGRSELRRDIAEGREPPIKLNE